MKLKKDKIALMGHWFTTLKEARKHAKQKGGRRITYVTEDKYLVL